MNSLGELPALSSTSSGSSMASSLLAVAYVLCSPLTPGTTSSHDSAWGSSQQHPEVRFLVPTSAGGTDSDDSGRASAAGRAAVYELRRLSGLTWNQLAHSLDVTPRSLHLWAGGRPMYPENEERLQRVLQTVRAIDRGNAAENRRVLLQARNDGPIALDLLAAKRYEDVVQRVGAGTAAARVVRSPISDAARAARRPLSIDDRAESSLESRHRARGGSRPVKVTRRE